MAKSPKLTILRNLAALVFQRKKYDALLTFQKTALERAAEQLWALHGGLDHYANEGETFGAYSEKMPDKARTIYAVSIFGNAKNANIDPVEYAENVIKYTRSFEPRIKNILPAIGADYNKGREYQIRDYIHHHPVDEADTVLDKVEKIIAKVDGILAKVERSYQRRNRRPKDEVMARKWQKMRAGIWALGPEKAVPSAQKLANRYSRLTTAADQVMAAPEAVQTFKKAAKPEIAPAIAPTPKTPLEILTDIRDAALLAYNDQDQNIQAYRETITGLRSSLDDQELANMEIAERRDDMIQTLLPMIDERQRLVTEIQQVHSLFVDGSAEELATMKAIYGTNPVETAQDTQKADKETAPQTAQTNDIAPYLESDDQAVRALAVETKEIRELIVASAPELDRLREEDAELAVAWKNLQKKNITDKKEVLHIAGVLKYVETEQPKLYVRHAQVVSNAGNSNRASSMAAPSMVLSK